MRWRARGTTFVRAGRRDQGGVRSVENEVEGEGVTGWERLASVEGTGVH